MRKIENCSSPWVLIHRALDGIRFSKPRIAAASRVSRCLIAHLQGGSAEADATGARYPGSVQRSVALPPTSAFRVPELGAQKNATPESSSSQRVPAKFPQDQHRNRHSWTRTKLSLAWDPELDCFDLRLEHGSVLVSSPVVNDPIPVRAGQWLTIRPRSSEVFIRDLAATTGNDARNPEHEADPSSPEPEAEPSAASAASASPPVAKGAPDTGHTWARDFLNGKAAGIVDDALRRGLDGCLAESDPSELSALADAARYTRRNDIARRALLAARRRFGGSRTAVDAALLLGRLAEAEKKDREAVSWFDTYLAEAPGGAHASEALGRKMAIVQHSAGAAAARSIAQEYLGKYPDGAYSSAARTILKSP